MSKVQKYSCTLGCDPEFFFSSGGKIVGAEKVLNKPIDGVIVDGVQVELNPAPSNCREQLAWAISDCFKNLRGILQEGVCADFSQTVKITKDELDSLSEENKRFGCGPSHNADGKDHSIKIDPTKYLQRSAGGHIHIGYHPKDPKRLARIMDVVVGNTCVLMDRDEGNVERRKHYGLAGEYRTPEHGFEYRTLSNFWLRAYPLYSFVFGLARHGVSIEENGLGDELLSILDREDEVAAINNNDFELAYRNFNKVKDFIVDTVPEEQVITVDTGSVHDGAFPLTRHTLPLFEHMVARGMDYWFKEDVIEHWCNLTTHEPAMGGSSKFLFDVVKPDYESS